MLVHTRLISIPALIACGLSLCLSAQADEKALLVEPQASQKWAILIGVNDYISVNDLRYCGNDIVALQKQFLAAGFRKDHVTLLHDQAAEKRYQPFKSNIESELDLLLGELDEGGTKLKKRGLVEKGDMIVIAFSGHGIHPRGENKSYFCPTDAVVERPATMISLEKLYKQLELCPANIKLLVVDACRNDPRLNGQKAMKATDETKGFAKTLENPPKGILVLSSCAPGQVSWEDKQLKHGVFMKYLLQGMRGAADAEEGNRNQKVSLLELYKYASSNTKTYVYRTKRKIQTPALKGDITGDFEFGRLTSPKPALLIAPFNKQEATAKQAAWAKHLKVDVVKTNRIGMKLKLIPAGEFLMGSGKSAAEIARLFDSKAEYFKNEYPQHRVRISKPFYLGTTEVTQKQWRDVMGTEPWKEKYAKDYYKYKEGADYAASYISWKDATEYCRKLSQKEGKTYRLPTEAEWEYACRAGSTTMYSFGDDASRLGDYAWYVKNASRLGETYAHRVGQKKANAFGLYDMHGNVWEWCQDWYDEDYYGKSPAVDPVGPASDSFRIFRGGSWFGDALDSRSALRPGIVLAIVVDRTLNGFRVVCELN